MAQQKLSQMQFQLDLQGEQYKRISDNIEKSRRMRHDFRHHMVAILGFFNNGETEKTKQYIGKYIRILDESVMPNICKNPIINTVASYYESLAKDSEISFTARIDVPQTLTAENSDIAVLLGNLLENAIEAAEQIKTRRRFISLNMICSGNMLAITVDNSFSGDIMAAEQGYLSTKINHTGIGLQSIRSIAGKYGGGVEFKHEINVFHASVMLNMK